MRSLIFEHQSLTNAISHPLIYPISSKGQFLTPRMALCVKLPTTLAQKTVKCRWFARARGGSWGGGMSKFRFDQRMTLRLLTFVCEANIE